MSKLGCIVGLFCNTQMNSPLEQTLIIMADNEFEKLCLLLPRKWT